MDGDAFTGAQRSVHEAVGGFLQEGEIAVGWLLNIEVVGPDGLRYIAHRSGGGVDGTEHPTLWSSLGILETASDTVRGQLLEASVPPEGDEEND